MVEEKPNVVRRGEDKIKVYSISFMVRNMEKNNHNFSFYVTKDPGDIKWLFEYALTVLVPGKDVISTGLGEMTEEEYADARAVLAETQEQIIKGGIKK